MVAMASSIHTESSDGAMLTRGTSLSPGVFLRLYDL